MKKTAIAAREERNAAADKTASRILAATFHTLLEVGYAGASTREIARRAGVSKRDLYAAFGSKEGLLAALIEDRAASMRMALQGAEARDRLALNRKLVDFGTTLLKTVCEPASVSLFRLAIAEAERSPAVAEALHNGARVPNRKMLTEMLRAAIAVGLLNGAAPEMIARQFLSLLLGDLQVALLMRVAKTPTPPALRRRAQAATASILRMYEAERPNVRLPGTLVTLDRGEARIAEVNHI